jgi:hypothetical protein
VRILPEFADVYITVTSSSVDANLQLIITKNKIVPRFPGRVSFTEPSLSSGGRETTLTARFENFYLLMKHKWLQALKWLLLFSRRIIVGAFVLIEFLLLSKWHGFLCFVFRLCLCVCVCFHPFSCSFYNWL